MDPKDPDLPTRAEALLNQTDWVRKVVRGLGVDESSAEDVVQSTWVAALTTPPRAAEQGPGLRAWIARVARNFALRRIDRDARRALRERDSAREERLPSTADVVEREEARAQVVRALLEVHEPFRTTLLLRFYEGLELRDIARVQKVPDSTVRNRLKRGLALLRERLEISQGPSWRQRCLLVLPALRAKPFWFPAPPKWIAATAASGGALVFKSLGIATAVALAAGGVYVAWNRTESTGAKRATVDHVERTSTSGSSGSARGGATAPSRERSTGGSTQLVAASPASTRAPAMGTTGTTSEASDPSDDDHRFALRGRLLSPDGKPLKPSLPKQVMLDSFFTVGRRIDDLRLSALKREVTISVPDVGTPHGDPEPAADPAAPEIDPVYKGDLARVRAPQGGQGGVDLRLGDLGPQTEPRVETVLRLSQSGPERISVRKGGELLDFTFGVADGGVSSSTAHTAHVLIASAGGDARERDLDSEGGFEFGDLRPGHWRLFATAPGFLSRRLEFEVGPGEREKGLDVTLEPSPNLRVKLVTPDGHDLVQAVSDDPELGPMFAPVPFAMRDAPGPRTADFRDNASRSFASGQWHPRSDGDDKVAGDDSGVLQLSDPLPLHVGLSVCGAVLDQRLVASGAEEVVFAVPLEKLRALVSGVTVRLVSMRDGQPIAGAQVEVEGFEPTTTDAQGDAVVQHISPGSHKISFVMDGIEHRSEWIEVHPGARTDLGVRELSPAIRLAGRVVDEDGAPIELGLHLSPLDAASPGHALPRTDEAASDAEGRFVFESAGRRRYLLSVEGQDWAAPVQTIDASGGGVQEILVHASRCSELKLTFPIEPPPGANYVVDTADGIPVAVQPADGWKPLNVRLGNGTYRVRIVADGRTLWTRQVIIQPGQMIAFDESAPKR